MIADRGYYPPFDLTPALGYMVLFFAAFQFFSWLLWR